MGIEALAQELQKKNIRPSYQRLKIYEYLVTRRTHPTADEIFHALITDIPTLSKTTVYNSLNLFEEAGLARVITIEDNEMRYDAGMSVHGHFKCEACGGVYDFPVDMNALENNTLAGFEINERNVYFKGFCPECKKTKGMGGLS